MYYLQGLSPVDILKLKRNQISLVTNEDGVKYIQIRGIHRSKTKIAVPMAVEYNDMTQILLRPYLTRETDSEWFYPFFDRPSNNPNNPDCTKNFLSTASKNLKRLWKRINLYAEKKNIKGWVPIPNETTLYTARHSFATHFYYKCGDVAALATLMGRSIQGIDVYIKQLTSDDYVLKQRKKLYNNNKNK